MVEASILKVFTIIVLIYDEIIITLYPSINMPLIFIIESKL